MGDYNSTFAGVVEYSNRTAGGHIRKFFAFTVKGKVEYDVKEIRYPWVFSVGSPRLYLEEPVAIDMPLSRQLEAFHNRDEEKPERGSYRQYIESRHMISQS